MNTNLLCKVNYQLIGFWPDFPSEGWGGGGGGGGGAGSIREGIYFGQSDCVKSRSHRHTRVCYVSARCRHP